MKKILLINIDQLKRDSVLDENVNDNMVRIAVEFIQDTIIERVTGECLYEVLTEVICSDEWDGDECFETLLYEYIQPIFVWGVPAELNIPLTFKERNIGTIQMNDENGYSLGMNDIKFLNNYYKNKMDFYISRANDYISCNDCFNKYQCPGCQSNIKGKGGYNCPIVFY